MNKNSGFTLVEILAVITIVGLLMTMAIPGINRLSKLMRERSLTSRFDLIEEAATMYGQNNANAIKERLNNSARIAKCDSEIAGVCVNKEKCVNYLIIDGQKECTSKNDYKYICYITISELIDSGYYKASDAPDCRVLSNVDNYTCLDDYKITLMIDADYKNTSSDLQNSGMSTASFNCKTGQ